LVQTDFPPFLRFYPISCMHSPTEQLFGLLESDEMPAGRSGKGLGAVSTWHLCLKDRYRR